MKVCRYCGSEDIPDAALKCRYCGEWVGEKRLLRGTLTGIVYLLAAMFLLQLVGCVILMVPVLIG